jgi:hypothetical protein
MLSSTLLCMIAGTLKKFKYMHISDSHRPIYMNTDTYLSMWSRVLKKPLKVSLHAV